MTAILVFTHAHIPVLAALTAVSAGVAVVRSSRRRAGTRRRGRWALARRGGKFLCLTVAQRALVRGVSRRKVIARAVTIVALALLAATATDLGPASFVAATVALPLLALVVFEMWAYSSHAGREAPSRFDPSRSRPGMLLVAGQLEHDLRGERRRRASRGARRSRRARRPSPRRRARRSCRRHASTSRPDCVVTR